MGDDNTTLEEEMQLMGLHGDEGASPPSSPAPPSADDIEEAEVWTEKLLKHLNRSYLLSGKAKTSLALKFASLFLKRKGEGNPVLWSDIISTANACSDAPKKEAKVAKYVPIKTEHQDLLDEFIHICERESRRDVDFTEKNYNLATDPYQDLSGLLVDEKLDVIAAASDSSSGAGIVQVLNEMLAGRCIVTELMKARTTGDVATYRAFIKNGKMTTVKANNRKNLAIVFRSMPCIALHPRVWRFVRVLGPILKLIKSLVKFDKSKGVLLQQPLHAVTFSLGGRGKLTLPSIIPAPLSLMFEGEASARDAPLLGKLNVLRDTMVGIKAGVEVDQPADDDVRVSFPIWDDEHQSKQRKRGIEMVGEFPVGRPITATQQTALQVFTTMNVLDEEGEGQPYLGERADSVNVTCELWFHYDDEEEIVGGTGKHLMSKSATVSDVILAYERQFAMTLKKHDSDVIHVLNKDGEPIENPATPITDFTISTNERQMEGARGRPREVTVLSAHFKVVVQRLRANAEPITLRQFEPDGADYFTLWDQEESRLRTEENAAIVGGPILSMQSEIDELKLKVERSEAEKLGILEEVAFLREFTTKEVGRLKTLMEEVLSNSPRASAPPTVAPVVKPLEAGATAQSTPPTTI
eukprot:m.59428 g.59428  ORF g.59428 m.59428 type:complete len:638 (+) comp17337_c0_seq2:133-2046(+)